MNIKNFVKGTPATYEEIAQQCGISYGALRNCIMRRTKHNDEIVKLTCFNIRKRAGNTNDKLVRAVKRSRFTLNQICKEAGYSKTNIQLARNNKIVVRESVLMCFLDAIKRLESL